MLSSSRPVTQPARNDERTKHMLVSSTALLNGYTAVSTAIVDRHVLGPLSRFFLPFCKDVATSDTIGSGICTGGEGSDSVISYAKMQERS